MTFSLSNFGERFSRPTGALQLMDDLGKAMGGEASGDSLAGEGGGAGALEHGVALLGGGNPAKIPVIQRIFRQRLAEVAANPRHFDRMVSDYAHPAGDFSFRRALARLLSSRYGWPLTEANIALTAGSQAAFFLLFNLFAGRGADGGLRRMLLPMTPEYVGYADVGLEAGLVVSRRPAITELPGASFKYHVDFGGLDIGADVAAVCVSRPANPTGNVLTDAELSRLANLCADARVPLIVDSAYGAPFPNIVFTEATPLWNDNVILCLSLSKLGLPGVRTGIVIADRQVVEALTNMTAVLNLAVGSVGPVLAQPLIDSGDIVDLCRREVMPFYRDKAQHARERLAQELAGLPFKIHEPEGGFFLWLWLPGLPITSAELYRRLKSVGVLVLSGHYFFPGLEGDWRHRDECIRISFAQEDAVVERGIRILASQVREAFDSARAQNVLPPR